MTSNSESELRGHHMNVPDGSEFVTQRETWRRDMAEDSALRVNALDLYRQADAYHFGYQWEWCGVPIIRLPDDIVLLQEIVWESKPTCVVETGVARGGSVVLSASLMSISGLSPSVLGLDIAIHSHTYEALNACPFASSIELWEGDSASEAASQVVEKFTKLHDPEKPVILILDSNHTHDHVLGELRALTPVLPVGSIIMVADTIIDELPQDYYPNRPWSSKSNPLTALKQFTAEEPAYKPFTRWNRRSLLSEFRDGVVIKRALVDSD